MKQPSSKIVPGMIDPSIVRNKQRRQEMVAEQMQIRHSVKKKLKMRRRKEEEKNPELKEERQRKNIPKTIDSLREADDTIVDADDKEVMEDEEMDEFQQYFQQGVEPKLLITTSRRPGKSTYEFADELVTIFPNAEHVKRPSQYEMKHIIEFSRNRGYTDIMLVNDSRREPNAVTFIHLPDGPTAHFKLTSVTRAKDVFNHGRQTAHQPELILNNFNTRLGHTVGRMFAALFPHVPQFQGRQVCTFHNQRDFIFFRRHRYMFKENGERADLQELGPRFTMKLQWLQKGTFDTKSGEYEWMRRPELETSRRRFFL